MKTHEKLSVDELHVWGDIVMAHSMVCLAMLFIDYDKHSSFESVRYMNISHPLQLGNQ
jgi:hypothetical protein